ncbi:hypothetical protein OF83DRAFT_1169786 [Amylostereum chailletii]|nr:hypothetical protein OF83DRAFT_1169786 [Amylostereum chailletii]
MFLLASAVLNVVVTVHPICNVLCRTYTLFPAPSRSVQHPRSSYVLGKERCRWRTSVPGPSLLSNAPSCPPTPSASPSSPTQPSPPSPVPPPPTLSPSDPLSDAAVLILTPHTSDDAATRALAKHAPSVAPSPRPDFVDDPLRRAQMQSYARAATPRHPAPAPRPEGLRPLLLPRRHGVREPSPPTHHRKSRLRVLVLPRRAGLQ